MLLWAIHAPSSVNCSFSPFGHFPHRLFVFFLLIVKLRTLSVLYVQPTASPHWWFFFQYISWARSSMAFCCAQVHVATAPCSHAHVCFLTHPYPSEGRGHHAFMSGVCCVLTIHLGCLHLSSQRSIVSVWPGPSGRLTAAGGL